MKAVIFDMDGVLFDTESLCMKAWDYAGEKLGIGPAGYMVLKTLGVNAQTAIGILKKEFGEDFNAEKFKKIGRDFSYDYFEKHGMPMKKGVTDILDYLTNKKYKIALASSTSTKSVMHHLNDTKIKDYFDVIVCGDQVERSKPEPDIYIKAAELLGLPPKACYAVEDSKNGLLSAHRAGCQVIMVPDLWQGDDETDSFILAKCSDLNEVIGVIHDTENEG